MVTFDIQTDTEQISVTWVIHNFNAWNFTSRLGYSANELLGVCLSPLPVLSGLGLLFMWVLGVKL